MKDPSTTLIIASNNTHKIDEIRAIMAPWYPKIHSLKEDGIEIDIEESGTTFAENALIKAEAIAALRPDCAVLADDTGLCVDALDGAPGVYSARYAGMEHDDEANKAKLLQALSDVPDAQRSAHFSTVLALLRPGCEPVIVEGRCDGQILHEENGDNGFGYDALFFFPERRMAFAEMTSEEKNEVSHRARALTALRDLLSSQVAE